MFAKIKSTLNKLTSRDSDSEVESDYEIDSDSEDNQRPLLFTPFLTSTSKKVAPDYLTIFRSHPFFHNEQVILASDLLNCRISIQQGALKPGITEVMRYTSFQNQAQNNLTQRPLMQVLQSPSILREVSDYKDLYALTFFYYELNPKNLWQCKQSNRLLNYDIHTANIFIKIKSDGFYTYGKFVEVEDEEERWTGLYRLDKYTDLNIMISKEMFRHERNSQQLRPQNILITFKDLIDKRKTLLQMAKEIDIKESHNAESSKSIAVERSEKKRASKDF